MSTFLREQEVLLNQTNLLREVVENKTQVDCSNKGIGDIAQVIDNNLDPVPTEDDWDPEDGYHRPDWYPNIETILDNAPDITIGSTTYKPYCSVLIRSDNLVDTFYKANSTTEGAANYFKGTGAEGYIFSDVVNNDIANASESTLTLGDTIEHAWDISKDITNQDSEYSLRWAVLYTNNLNSTKYFFANMPYLELIWKDNKISYALSPSSAIPSGWGPLHYIKIKGPVGGIYASGFGQGSSLFEVDLSEIAPGGNSSTFSVGSYFLQGVRTLSKILFPYNSNFNTLVLDGSNILYHNGLNKLIIPSNFSTIKTSYTLSIYNLNKLIFKNKNYNLIGSSNNSFLELSKELTLDLSGCNSIQTSTFFYLRQAPFTQIPNIPINVSTSNSFTPIKGIPDPYTLANFNLTYPNSVTNVVESVGIIGILTLSPNTATCTARLQATKINVQSDVEVTGSNVYLKSDEINLPEDYNANIAIHPIASTPNLSNLQDMVIKMKDNTGSEAKIWTMYKLQLSCLQNNYCKYNTSDKKDIIFTNASGTIIRGTETAGATYSEVMTLADFMTNVKNWTLSSYDNY